MSTRRALVVPILLLTTVVSLAQEAPQPEAPALTDQAKALLKQLDKDGDGKLTTAEIPERHRKTAAAHDADGDGVFADAELNALAKAAAELQPATPSRGTPAKDPASGLYLVAAHDYHKATRGEALLVLKEGKVVFQANDNGYDGFTPHELASGTKSFAGIAAACAVEDGLFTWDESVCNTLTEWKDDPRRSRITVRMLLSLCAGLPPEQDALQGPQTSDKYAYAVNLKCKREPGTRFEYGPAQYFAFGEFLKRKLKDKGENIHSYFMRRVGKPIGMELIWTTDAVGNPAVPHGIFIHVEQWAKLGEFVRLGGKHGDKQLLKTEIMDECFKPSACNPSYGLTWWLGSGGAEAADGQASPEQEPAPDRATPKVEDWQPRDLAYAAGKGKQRLIVSRSLGLTVVRFADDTGTFDDRRFLSLLLRGRRE
ncbi:MAG: serine hydrolase [Planctomycetes bacterium]|nr:serine hydrolase [Planctomycetota bacterium]